MSAKTSQEEFLWIEDEHPDKVCPETNCFDDKCPFRHPNPCKFEYRCKFNAKKICLFSHVTLASEDDKKIKEVREKVNSVEKEIKALNAFNKELIKKIDQKYLSFDQRIEYLKKENEIKDTQISSLETKINEQQLSFNAKLTNLEKQVNSMENKFKCDECKFVTNSETALKSHMTKKHKKEKFVDDSIYPKQCSLCEKVYKNSKELKKHMRTHSYNYVTFKCTLCDFVGGEALDMEVHTATTHSDDFECGLCDFEGKDKENLDIHLTTCESYLCGLCEDKIKMLTDIKEHFKIKHEKSKTSSLYGVTHVKPSRQNKEIYVQTFHTFQSLFPDN